MVAIRMPNAIPLVPTTAVERPPTTAGQDRLGDGRPPQVAPRNLSILARALVETFEPGTRIVWNRAGATTRAAGGRPRWRIDGAHRDGGSTPPPAAPVILQVPDRSFVARIRGLGDARRALNDDAWIVAVVAERPETAPSLLEDLRPLVETEPRLLVVPAGREWTGELVVPGGDAGADEPVLDELRVWLARVRFEDRSRVLAPLEPLVAEAVPEVPLGHPIRDRLDEGLVDRGLSDTRFVLVRERETTAFSRFARLFPDRTFEVESVDESTLAWCAGLVDGGCRLVLSVRGESLERVVESAGDLSTSVLVVAEHDDPGSCSLAASRWPGSVIADPETLDFDRDSGGGLQIVFVSAEPGRGRTAASEGGRAEPSLAERCGFTPEALRGEHEAVLATELGPELESWFRQYASVGSRPRYLWQWCARAAEVTALPCVPDERRLHVRDTKVLSIFLDVLLDDAIDEHHDWELLQDVLRVVTALEIPPRANRPHEFDAYLSVAHSLATTYRTRVREYPLYERLARVLEFDNEQFFNAMRYGGIVSEDLHLLNVAEHELYLPHGMHMMGFATLDLMCSPDFDLTELGLLREAIWHAACMGRIGNVLATWRREIAQRDFTSGVFARAVVTGDATVERLRTASPREIASLIEEGGHEDFFRQRWWRHRTEFEKRAASVRSADLLKLLAGQDRFLRMHLACRGRI